MSNEFTDVLEMMNIEDEKLKSMRSRVIESCSSVLGAQQMRELLKSKDSKLCICVSSFDYVTYCSVENKPYCLMYKAYAHYCLDYFQETIDSSMDAFENFETMAQPLNQALALWGCALAQIKLNNLNQAQIKLQDAKEILHKLILRLKQLGKYSEIAPIEMVVSRIMVILDQQKNKPREPFVSDDRVSPRRGYKEPHPEQPKRPSSWPSDQLVFPVYDYVRAGIEGRFIFDSQPEISATINELMFDSIPHRIYNIREEGLPITLFPAVYRWLRVEGDSMDLTEPVPILAGDYVLTIELDRSDYSVRNNDIVVAAVRNPTMSERAGVIKKYTPKGLCSVSNLLYPTIPLDKVKIRGLVIAVAKPSSQEKE